MPDNLPSFKTYRFVIPKGKQKLWQLYEQWWKLLSYRGLHLKNCNYNMLYRAVTNRTWSKSYLLGRLQQEFIKENLSLSLLLEPLDGFEWLSKNRYPLILSDFSPILLQIIAPISRLIGVLNNQHPTFYHPFSNLLYAYSALYIINMPTLEPILNQALITIDNKRIKEILPLLHKEAKQILPFTTGLRFKIIIAFYLGLYRILLRKKLQNKVIFSNYVNAFLYGFWYILTIRRKKIRSNRI